MIKLVLPFQQGKLKKMLDLTEHVSCTSKFSYCHSKVILKSKIKSQKNINFKFLLKKLDVKRFSGLEMQFLPSANKKVN